MMRTAWYCCCYVAIFITFSNCELQESNQIKSPTTFSIISGTGLLAIECIGIPYFDFKYNYRMIPKVRNPFRYVFEKEPYCEDELWHFTGASLLAEVNYRVFRDCFVVQNPYIASAVLTIALMTGMECCDAWCGSGFSIRDECGNVLGTVFSLVKMRYPDFPFKVRIGIKDIGAFNNGVKNVINESIHHQMGKQYDYMKVELIYTIPDLFLYTGVAVSRTEKKDDQFGITAGFDIPDYVNSLKQGWWNEPLSFASRYFAVSVSFTLWL